MVLNLQLVFDSIISMTKNCEEWQVTRKIFIWQFSQILRNPQLHGFWLTQQLDKEMRKLQISHKIVDLAIYCNSPEFCDLEREKSGKMGMYTKVPQPCRSRKLYNEREKLPTSRFQFRVFGSTHEKSQIFAAACKETTADSQLILFLESS